MAWTPIDLNVPQYVDANGDPYSGAVLKAYAAGTTTNINFATDNTGATTASSVALNASGFPEVSGNVVIPHVEQDFKLALYATQAAADADSGALWTVDNISLGQVTTEWVDSGVTPTHAGGTQFTLSGDQTTEFHVGRRLRLTDSGGTDYASITVSAYTSLTTITVSVDGGGVLDSGLSAVDLSILSADNSAMPHISSSASGLNVTGSLSVGGVDVTTPTTTRGDLIRRGASADERVEIGSDGQLVASDGTDALWEWKGIVQRVDTTHEASASTSTTIPSDDTVPQSTEGAELMTVAITPKATAHTLLIEVLLHISTASAGYQIAAALFQDSDASAIAASTMVIGDANNIAQIRVLHTMTAGTTSETTFKVRYGPNGGTAYVNSAGGAGRFGGVMLSRISVTEIAG